MGYWAFHKVSCFIFNIELCFLCKNESFDRSSWTTLPVGKRNMALLSRPLLILLVLLLSLFRPPACPFLNPGNALLPSVWLLVSMSQAHMVRLLRSLLAITDSHCLTSHTKLQDHTVKRPQPATHLARQPSQCAAPSFPPRS